MEPAANLSQRAQWAGGQPISRLMQMALANPGLISLAAGFVDQPSLPVDATRQAVERVLAEPSYARAALQYGPTSGDARLRELVLERFRQADGHPAAERDLSIEQVLLTAGSNQLLHLVAEALLDPGDIVLCAAPTYFVFLGILGNLGARAIGVASDTGGPDSRGRSTSNYARSIDWDSSIASKRFTSRPISTTRPASRSRPSGDRKSSRLPSAGHRNARSTSSKTRPIASCAMPATTSPACAVTTRANGLSWPRRFPSRFRPACGSAGEFCRRTWSSRSPT